MKRGQIRGEDLLVAKQLVGQLNAISRMLTVDVGAMTSQILEQQRTIASLRERNAELLRRNGQLNWLSASLRDALKTVHPSQQNHKSQSSDQIPLSDTPQRQKIAERFEKLDKRLDPQQVLPSSDGKRAAKA